MLQTIFLIEDSQIILNEQKNLETDVDLLNSFIVCQHYKWYKNCKMGQRPCKIHSKRRGTNKKLKKVVHYRCVDLYDGLHPHVALSELWFDVMCDSINRDLNVLLQMRMGLLRMRI